MKYYEDVFQDEQSEFLHDLFSFLTFKTISAAYPETKKEMFQCVRFLEDYMKGMFSTELWETEDHPPVVFAQNLNAGPNCKTLLLYMHYDVQPVEPLNEWLSDPFKPEIRNGSVYARGASDNKGQCFYTLFALKAFFKKHGCFPINLKIIIDGEEEIGSAGLSILLQQKEDLIKADDLFIIDGDLSSPNQPSITIGARGMANIKVNITEGNIDLHSGCFGGAAYNPNKALAQAIASIHDENNKVLIEGFYEDIRALSKQEKQLLEQDNKSFDSKEKEYLTQFGFVPSGMEKGYSLYEALNLRPTLEICGIGGGYTGPGFKTVIPKKATAYLSCRLVPDQSPEKIIKALKNHFSKHVPQHLKVDFEFIQGASGWRTSEISEVAQRLSKTYEHIFGVPSGHRLMGATIPIAVNLRLATKASTIICGVATDEDNIHAPNEKFSLEQSLSGFRSICEFLEECRNSEK